MGDRIQYKRKKLALIGCSLSQDDREDLTLCQWTKVRTIRDRKLIRFYGGVSISALLREL